MAKLAKDQRGNYYIQFANKDGEFKTLRPPKVRGRRVSKRDAENIRYHVSELAQSLILGGVPAPKTARWLTDASEQLRERLAKVGLCESRTRGVLGPFIDSYVASRTDAKKSTKGAWKPTHDSLRNYFGEDRPLRSITKGDAKAWRVHIAKGRAENTVRKRTAIAKTLFNAAVDFELIDTNPFGGLKSTIIENRERDYFVTEAEAVKVLAECPNQDWRTIFALCRWGGLRCPTEVLALRWGDVLWDKGRFIVTSPKTEHHVGHGRRIVPLFPKLLEELNKAWDLVPEEGTEYVVNSYRQGCGNLRTHFARIITRAGLKPWPKLFHALRATRATELADQYPGHVVNDWLGHCEQVANKHYRQVTDAHFEQAIKSEKRAAPGSAQSAEVELQDVIARIANTGNADVLHMLQILNIQEVGDTGFEPVTSAV